MTELVNPYLIQRAEIRRPLGTYRGQRFGETVRLDYMGSSEFEWGALPDSLRQLGNNVSALTIRKVMDITEDDKPLRVLSYLSDADFESYKGFLRLARADKLHTKEAVHFNPNSKIYCGRTDLWWDLNNHTMWSFDKSFMSTIIDSIALSMKYMNEKREAKVAGG